MKGTAPETGVDLRDLPLGKRWLAKLQLFTPLRNLVLFLVTRNGYATLLRRVLRYCKAEMGIIILKSNNNFVKNPKK
jgi:hypothetical protein